MISLSQLTAILPHSRSRAPKYIDALNEAMGEFAITTKARQAAFLAQIGHESGQLLYVQEIWGPTAAQLRYEGRKDLGNTQPGDGRRFAGHGFIQVTGRANHFACALYFDKTMDEIVQWLISPEGACRSAGWFWHTHDLNDLADAGDFAALTKKINGGYNGLSDRVTLYNRAINVLGER